MLKLFNSYRKKIELFRPVNNRVTTIFTCGPSVYQQSHIGNFRTFLFEDVLVRYLEYSGHTVTRGMTVTDIEDKAIEEAARNHTNIQHLAGKNMRAFIRDMNLLKMKKPDYLSKASENVKQSAEIIAQLLKRGVAYRHKGDIYFDPLMFPGFGRLYGLDMSKWPRKKMRFHKDTYPGMRWNLGDFILWHACRQGDGYCRNSAVGSGRPSWNVQDPAIVMRYFNEPLSIYCGGIDNLIRHHDYSRAILESLRRYPMARFWLHCHHLLAEGRKMSKSKGNIIYIETLLKQGHSPKEIRFFLIYGQYRENLNYSKRNLKSSTEVLHDFKKMIGRIRKKAGNFYPDNAMAVQIEEVFTEHMNNDLDVRGAVDALRNLLSDMDISRISPEEASGLIGGLKKLDSVLRVIF